MIKKYKNGDWEEFKVVNNKKQGKAIYHYSENNEFSRKYEILNYIDGVRQGEATLYWTKEFEGDYEVRNYVDGKVQGKAIYYFSDGGREERTYVDDVLQGKTIYYFSKEFEGDCEIGNYVDGVLQGKAIYYFSDGGREERTYVDDVLQGKAIYYFSDGGREEHTYVDGKVQGKAIYYFSDGGREERTYVDDVLQGKAIYYFSDGGREECTYVDGVLQGKAVCYFFDGKKEEYTYVNGTKQKSNNSIKTSSSNNSIKTSSSNIKEKGKIIKTYYENGNLKDEYITYGDGAKDIYGNLVSSISKHYYENGNLKDEDVSYGDGAKDIYGNLVSSIREHYYENGNLEDEWTRYTKVRKMPEYNNLSIEDTSFIVDIKRKNRKYNESGKLTEIIFIYDTSNPSNNTTPFESSVISYNDKEEVYYVKIRFRKRIIEYYYEDRILVKMTKSKIGGDVYKTVYYEKNGNVSYCDTEDEDSSGGFLGRIFSGLGSAVSEKISNMDIKETLININETLDKYKK